MDRLAYECPHCGEKLYDEGYLECKACLRQYKIVNSHIEELSVDEYLN